MRMRNSIPHNHEDHIAGKGENSLQHYNLVHKFIPMPQAMKIPAAKAAVDKEWEKCGRKFRRGTWGKSKVRNRWSRKQGRRALQFILHHLWIHVIWKMLNWRQNTRNTKVELGSAVILSKIILDLMQHSLNKDLQHLKWQRLRSWTSSPDCWVATDKQQTQYQLKLKWKWKIGRYSQNSENSQIGASRHLDSSTTTQIAKFMVQYGRPSRSSWAKSVRSSFGRTVVGKAIWESPIETWLGENSK